jgi:hypothetical protein
LLSRLVDALTGSPGAAQVAGMVGVAVVAALVSLTARRPRPIVLGLPGVLDHFVAFQVAGQVSVRRLRHSHGSGEGTGPGAAWAEPGPVADAQA